jgi:nitronate monooxygenase
LGPLVQGKVAQTSFGAFIPPIRYTHHRIPGYLILREQVSARRSYSSDEMPSKSPSQSIRNLTSQYPWSNAPLIVQAPMKSLAGAALAVAVSEAGGLGFIGPGERPEQLQQELDDAANLVMQSKKLSSHLSGLAAASSGSGGSGGILPVGFGIQTWTGDLAVTTSILRQVASTHPPCAVWLFAPRNGQNELDGWIHGVKQASPKTKIWTQHASVMDAFICCHVAETVDVIVIQGSDAGGHSRVRGAGVITLVPELADALASTYSKVPIVAAGGLCDARGVAAVLALGAAGAAMGTRFLATPEARINPGYQRAILSAKDGGQTTVRTQLYNHLRGTMNWPEEYDARGLINASWRDYEAGMSFEQNKELHDSAIKRGEDAWGEEHGRTATYAGTGVGLVKDAKPAAKIVKEVRDGVKIVLGNTMELVQNASTSSAAAVTPTIQQSESYF